MDATMNFTLSFSANSDKKIPFNDRSVVKFSKSISCQNMDIDIAPNGIDQFDDEEYVAVERHLPVSYFLR